MLHVLAYISCCTAATFTTQPSDSSKTAATRAALLQPPRVQPSPPRGGGCDRKQRLQQRASVAHRCWLLRLRDGCESGGGERCAAAVAAGEANAEAAAAGQGTGVQLAVGGAHMLADAEEEQ